MTTEYPRVALVASPDAGAEVRCDLNEDATWPNHDAFSMGAPPLIGDPGGIGASYGFRTLSFNLTIDEGERRALAKQSELARELMRDENWLLFQLSPDASPVWFRCVRSSLGEVSLANVYLDGGTNLWSVAVSLVAYPFAYGETVQQGVTLSNDPTDGGVAVVLEDAVGDAPAPLVISGIDGSLYRPLIAVTPLTDWAGIQVWDHTSFVGVPGAFDEDDPEAFGGMAEGLQPGWSVVASVTTAQAGTYRLFARVRNTTTHSTLTAGGTAAVKPQITTGLPASSNYFYVDMGLYAFPRGNMPLESDYTLAPAGDWTTPEVTLRADASTGTAEVYVGGIVAVPVDLFESAAPSRMLTLANNALLGLRIDGEKGRIGPIPGPDPISSRTSDRIEGDFPQIVPGAVNVLTVLTKVQADDVPMSSASEPLGTSSVLNVRYRPRWLYLAGG